MKAGGTKSAARGAVSRATMQDIATRLNVHHTTVSLCLRGSPRVRAETRERVWQAAAELGYHRDPLLDTFNQRRVGARQAVTGGAMALIVDRPLGRTATEDPRVSVLQGARQVAHQFGFSIDVMLVGDGGLSYSRLGAVLRSRAMHGVIVTSVSPAVRDVALEWDKLIGIRIESYHLAAALDIVTPNHRQAARLAVRHLKATGYRRIGLALRSEAAATLGQLWRVGYIVELQPSPDNQWVHPYVFAGDADDPRHFRQWVKYHALDAIVTDYPTFPDFCRRAQLVCPGEIGWVALDGRQAAPHGTAIEIDWAGVGSAAAHAVAIRQKANQFGLSASVAISYIPVSLRVGLSTPQRVVPQPI